MYVSSLSLLKLFNEIQVRINEYLLGGVVLRTGTSSNVVLPTYHDTIFLTTATVPTLWYYHAVINRYLILWRAVGPS
jgi:hypothetical protein